MWMAPHLAASPERLPLLIGHVGMRWVGLGDLRGLLQPQWFCVSMNAALDLHFSSQRRKMSSTFSFSPLRGKQ